MAIVAAAEPALTAAIAAAARRAWPREACGILAGRRNDSAILLEAVVPLPNVAAHRDRFAVDAADFAAVTARFERRGLQLLGFWHSHTNGDPTPSSIDRHELWREHLHVIAGVTADRAPVLCAWWLDRHGDFAAVQLRPSIADR